jgi:hypothetical protein
LSFEVFRFVRIVKNGPDVVHERPQKIASLVQTNDLHQHCDTRTVIRMTITPEELHAFQEAYKIDFGEAITEDEAREMLTRLVLFYERMAQPLPILRRDSVADEAGDV